MGIAAAVKLYEPIQMLQIGVYEKEKGIQQRCINNPAAAGLHPHIGAYQERSAGTDSRSHRPQLSFPDSLL